MVAVVYSLSMHAEVFFQKKGSRWPVFAKPVSTCIETSLCMGGFNSYSLLWSFTLVYPPRREPRVEVFICIRLDEIIIE